MDCRERGVLRLRHRGRDDCPAVDAAGRALATAGGAAGLVITGAAYVTLPTRLLQDWLVPPALLLLGYWTSGQLFAAPMPRVEAALSALDRWLEIGPAARATPRWLAEVLELAYAGVYVLVPIALVIHLGSASEPDPARFWTVILITDFVCFGCLPWIQTRPPRALSAAPPWDTALRRLNLRLLGTTSIHVNTFPSGHAAEARGRGAARRRRALAARGRGRHRGVAGVSRRRARPLSLCGRRVRRMGRGAGGVGGVRVMAVAIFAPWLAALGCFQRQLGQLDGL